MTTLPILTREIRRNSRSSLFWTAALGLPAWAAAWTARGHAPVIVLLVLAGIIAFYAAWRTMLAEREDDALWMLAATPISPLSLVVQVGLASALVWSVAILGSAFVIQDVTWHQLSGLLGTGLPFIVLAGLHGALIALWLSRDPMRLGTIAAMLIPTSIAVGAGMATGHLSSGEMLFMGTLLFAGGYLAWRGTGAEWPSAMLMAESGRGTSGAKALSWMHRVTGWWGAVPDMVSPLLWKELMRGKTVAMLLAGLGSGLLVLEWSFARHPESSLALLMVVALYLGTIFLTVNSASSVMRDRREGVWEELRVTGLSPASIVRAKVLGMLTIWLGALAAVIAADQVLAICAPFFWLGKAMCYRSSLGHPCIHAAWTEAAGMALVLVLVWWQAILTGLVGGLVANGWKGFVVTVMLSASYVFAAGYVLASSDKLLYWLMGGRDPVEATALLCIFAMMSALYIAATTRFARLHVHAA